ncbi:MAG: hypothetical protein AAGH87_06360 [Pseudomonadota bacterium]
MAKAWLTLIAALALPACATAFRGPNVPFEIVTEPPGARVSTDLLTPKTRRENRNEARLVSWGHLDEPRPVEQVYYGCEATPCSFEVSRRSEFAVTLEREGFHTAQIAVTSNFGRREGGAAVAGNVAAVTGAYVVGFNLTTSFVSAFTLGTATTGALATSAATTAAAGVGVMTLGVDVLTGAMLDLSPNPLVVILVPEDEPVPSVEDQYLVTEEALDAVLKSRSGDPGPPAN